LGQALGRGGQVIDLPLEFAAVEAEAAGIDQAAPAAKSRRLLTGATGRDKARARPRPKESPMRKPVKKPGPMLKARPVRSALPTPAASKSAPTWGARRPEWVIAVSRTNSPNTRPWSARATPQGLKAVSMASTGTVSG